MKANKLRIGNLILHHNHKIKESFDECIVWMISEDHLRVRVNDLHNEVVSADYCSGIPLTEEWLLKFGFEKTKIAGINFRLGNFVLNKISPIGRYVFFEAEWVPEIFDFDLRSHVRSNIIYVHQLQNLYFALTNTELEVK